MGISGKCSTFVVLLFASISLNAQRSYRENPENDWPDAPSVVRADLPDGADFSSSSLPHRALPLVSVITVRPPARVADKQFWMVNGFHLFWTVADVEITAAGMRANPACREYNPLVPRRPSRLQLYVSNVPVLAAAGYMSYRAKKKQQRNWYRAPAIVGLLHAAAFGWDATGSSCLK